MTSTALPFAACPWLGVPFAFLGLDSSPDARVRAGSPEPYSIPVADTGRLGLLTGSPASSQPCDQL